jgi:hypothetical protein
MPLLLGGFQVRVSQMVKALPYPVQVVLPPIAGEQGEPKPPRKTGPVLDIYLPQNDDRHLNLGMFLDAWSLMEQNLSFLISKLLRADLKSADLVMSTLGVRQIIDLLTALGVIKLAPESTDALINLTDRLRRLNSKRNTLVHGHWVLEASIYVRKGEAVLVTQFLRELAPNDPKVAAAISNPRNQKERARYCFNSKRILGVTRDVQTLNMDVTAFIDNMRYAPITQDNFQDFINGLLRYIIKQT